VYVSANSRMLRLSSGLPARRRRFRRIPVGVGLGQLTAVAQAIENQEGYYPGSLAYVNNNPGNLMAAGQPNCTATSAGFCSFPTFADGWNALLNQISLDAGRGETISQFISKYAPASDGNDPTTYADNVASAVGLPPSALLSTAISQSGAGTDASSSSPGDSVFNITLPDLSDVDAEIDSSLGSNGIDLSSIGLGVVDPAVLIAAGLGLLLVFWVVNRK
jgi:hypothetical protein